MRQIITFLLLSFSCLPSFSQGSYGGNTTTTQVTNIVNSIGVSKTNGWGTNTTIEYMVLKMTNTYIGAGTISSKLNSPIFTNSAANGFAGWQPGMNFYTTNFGSDQYLVVEVLSSNTVMVSPWALHNYTNVNYGVYPNSMDVKDINGNQAGGIAGDSTVVIIGRWGRTFNSGILLFANGTNSIFEQVTSQALGKRFDIGTQKGNMAAPFNFYVDATYDCLSILPDGNLAVRFGITNMFSSVIPVASLFQMTNGVASFKNNKAAPTSITFPATTTTWTNTQAFNIQVYIDNTGVTGTAIKKNGTTISTAVSGNITIGLQPGDYFSETYSVGTPVATWSAF